MVDNKGRKYIKIGRGGDQNFFEHLTRFKFIINLPPQITLKVKTAPSKKFQKQRMQAKKPAGLNYCTSTSTA